MARASGRVFEFGSFRLDMKQGVLLRDGRRVNLIPKAVALLAELVAEAGSVVTKDELLQRVWSDSFVQEGNLSKLVFLLRQELARGSGAGTIETISKRGYVFSGHVREIAQAPPDTAEPLRTIAVLPFATAAGAPGHLGEGVADEVLVTLTRVRALSVMARTSSFRFGGTDVGVIAVGRRLQVAWLVEGSVRTDGDRIRVTAALVETATAVRRWSDTFDGSGSDLLRISEAIASGIAAVLVAGNPAAAPARPSVDAQAYDWYLQGRYLWNRRPGPAANGALECFQKATSLDPTFAAAWAGIADVYSTWGSWEAGVLPHAEAQAKARLFAERALALDPHLAEAHTTLAYTALHYNWDPIAAETGFAQALRENPTYATAHHWRSHALVVQERFDESLAASRLALSHDPMNLLLTIHIAWHYHMARQPERALEQAERVIHLDPHFHWGHYFRSWAAEALHDPTTAVDAARQAVQCVDGHLVMRALLGRVLAVAGDVRGARAIADVLIAEDPDLARYAYEAALIELGLGNYEQAIDLFERAHTQRSGWMVYAHVDPRLDPVRTHPRFSALPLRRTEIAGEPFR